MSWHSTLIATGQEQLLPILSLVDAADPHQRVTPPNRLLCAGLSELARSADPQAPPQHQKDSLQAATLLSLLTKIDDQVIDAPGFHQDRRDLENRLRAYLAPTLKAIFSPHHADLAPRCQLAARLGEIVARFPKHRHEPLLTTIEQGWETQVQAVLHLTLHPREAHPPTLEQITTQISTDWLKMIALCGTLSPESRAFDADELAGFEVWGHAIQRADALTDLAKDREEGHFSALPSLYLFQVDPDAWAGGAEQYYRAVAGYGIDRRLIQVPIKTGLETRPELNRLLSWVQQFLLARYRNHPLCRMS